MNGLWHSRVRAQSSSTLVNGEKAASDFDWQLGLCLAGCAFEAYNGLDEGDGQHLRQISTGGTEVTYVDPRFLEKKMAGLLEVTVVGASGLKSADVRPGSQRIRPLQHPHCLFTRFIYLSNSVTWYVFQCSGGLGPKRTLMS